MPDPTDNSSPETKTFNRDSVSNTLTVAIGLSLVCSILVAGAAVALKPIQEINEKQFRQRIIVNVAGLMGEDTSLESALANIESRMLDFETGEFVGSMDVESFDPAVAANDPDMSVAIPGEEDIANIRRRSTLSPVYLVRDGDRIDQIILPVHGAGLWSTMYGYLAIDSDGATVRGLQFYSHGETPGLGDQIDRPEWRAQWEGKQLFDDAGAPRIEVIRGLVNTGADNPDAHYQIDGLSGATLTGRGVSNLVRYWTGPHAFGPWLATVRQSEGMPL